MSSFIFFFFQAEDGIRDKLVTGVQTCALPISLIGRVMMVRLRDGAITPLTDPTHEAYPEHISTRNYDRPGWAYVSYYPAPGRRFSDEVVAVKLDGSKAVERFAHLHTDVSGCYRCEAHAVPSRDGRRVLWASNWMIAGANTGRRSLIQAYVVEAGGGAQKTAVHMARPPPPPPAPTPRRHGVAANPSQPLFT